MAQGRKYRVPKEDPTHYSVVTDLTDELANHYTSYLLSVAYKWHMATIIEYPVRIAFINQKESY